MLAAVAALALTAAMAAGADARGVERVGCSIQSFGGFQQADAEDLVAGPLAFVGAFGARDSTPGAVEYIGGFKSPALLRPGHVARVSIDRASRSNVRLDYSFTHEPDDALRTFPHTVVFHACPRRRAGSRANGRRVTFWSGFYLVRDAPTCVHVTIRIDGGRARHRQIPVAQPSCP